MTTPRKSISPGLALLAYALLTLSVGVAGWWRSPWPLLAGCVVFVVLAVIGTRRNG
jgi:hypothetical protein